MRKILFESLNHGPLTEPAPAPSQAGLAELAKAVNRAARARLGRSLSIRQVDAGLDGPLCGPPGEAVSCDVVAVYGNEHDRVS